MLLYLSGLLIAAPQGRLEHPVTKRVMVHYQGQEGPWAATLDTQLNGAVGCYSRVPAGYQSKHAWPRESDQN